MMKNEEVNKTLTFSAVVEFADDNSNETFDVEINKDINSLTYDDVEAAVWNAVDEKYGYMPDDFEDDAPYSIVDLVVNEDGESYPVIPDSVDAKKYCKENDVKKCLVLPWARYSLTPECKLWMSLKKNALIDEDEPFDFELYHELIESASSK